MTSISSAHPNPNSTVMFAVDRSYTAYMYNSTVIVTLIHCGSLEPEESIRIYRRLRCNASVYLARSTGSTRCVDFSKCNEEWDYNTHCFEDAADSVEAVRKELMKFPCPHVVVALEDLNIAYLVDTKPLKLRNCHAWLSLPIIAVSWFESWLIESCSYRFVNAEELKRCRYEVHELQWNYDFGPSLQVKECESTEGHSINGWESQKVVSRTGTLAFLCCSDLNILERELGLVPPKKSLSDALSLTMTWECSSSCLRLTFSVYFNFNSNVENPFIKGWHQSWNTESSSKIDSYTCFSKTNNRDTHCCSTGKFRVIQRVRLF